MFTQRRVVVTGIGAVTPLGLTAHESWNRLKNGESGVDKITLIDPSKVDIKIAAEVKGFNPTLLIGEKESKRMDRFIQLAVVAASQALEDSKLKLLDDQKQRAGVFIGSGIGGVPQMETDILAVNKGGPSAVNMYLIPMCTSSMAAGTVSVIFGFKGPQYSIASACSSGLHSIGEAANCIRFGMADVMLAGGAESTITPTTIAAFNIVRAMSKNPNPKEASRPFSVDRDGFVIGEGAAVLVLEEYEAAKKRGAHIYAEVTGYGLSSDGFHILAPAKDGNGARRAMEMALNSANLNPTDIQYISAHGTSTPAGDLAESIAIKSLYGADKDRAVISSMKSMLGHSFGASGAVESVFCMMAMKDGVVPPTINLQNQDPLCDLDCVPNVARKLSLQNVMKNSFGFGGTNASVIYSRVED